MHQTLLEVPSSTNGFRDSAFAKNKELPVHRWVPWIAGFSAHFVDDCLSRYLTSARKNYLCVLDPFAGVGTTLVQAYLRGFNVVGFEINPYAALASKIKLDASRIKMSQLKECLQGFERFMKSRSDSSNGTPQWRPPDGFSGRTQLFSPAVQRKVLFALDYINSIEGRTIRDFFRVAFGSVMVHFSNYSYEPSLTRRSAVQKDDILDANVGLEISSKLKMMIEDLEWFNSELAKLSHLPKSHVYPETFFSATKYLRRNSIDLLVTSPPYLNNYHYPRNTRPQLHWLGLASGPGYKSAGEDESFGKFWQTVRDAEAVRLTFCLTELAQTIEEIRHVKAERGPYGGAGWANYIATYFNDAYRFCQIVVRILRPGAKAVIVLGNSIIQGVEVPTDVFFGKIAELCGLRFDDNLLLRKKRTGTSIIQSSVRVEKAARKTVLYESAIVLSKPISYEETTYQTSIF